MKFTKAVLMPIKVPVGDYCWNEKRICKHFTNEQGNPECYLGFHPLKYDKSYFVPKPKECKDLKEEIK